MAVPVRIVALAAAARALSSDRVQSQVREWRLQESPAEMERRLHLLKVKKIVLESRRKSEITEMERKRKSEIIDIESIVRNAVLGKKNFSSNPGRPAIWGKLLPEHERMGPAPRNNPHDGNDYEQSPTDVADPRIGDYFSRPIASKTLPDHERVFRMAVRAPVARDNLAHAVNERDKTHAGDYYLNLDDDMNAAVETVSGILSLADDFEDEEHFRIKDYFSNLQTVGTVDIAESGLQRVDLAGIQTARGDVYIELDHLTSFSMPDLQEVAGTLSISFKSVMTGLDVRSLRRVGGNINFYGGVINHIQVPDHPFRTVNLSLLESWIKEVPDMLVDNLGISAAGVSVYCDDTALAKWRQSDHTAAVPQVCASANGTSANGCWETSAASPNAHF